LPRLRYFLSSNGSAASDEEEKIMDRRLFLTGLVGLAGAAALGGASRPVGALAGVPDARGGILDALDAPEAEVFEDDGPRAEVEPVQYWRRHGRRHRRRHRRRVWRRVCRSYWRHGRRHVRCRRVRVWVWV
jgi:hypothetical protein